MAAVEARAREAGAAAARRLAARVGAAVAAAAPGVAVTIEEGRVVLSGRGLDRRLAGELRWIGGLLR